ncbi:MAG: hypothetical protein AVDCRST_MAG59-4410, partial [uncultured Thermomicrobiales bacterium]
EGLVCGGVRAGAPRPGSGRGFVRGRARPAAGPRRRRLPPHRPPAGREAFRGLAPVAGRAVLLRHRRLAGGRARSPGVDRVRRGRRGGGHGGAGGPGVLAARGGAGRAVGPDRHAPARAGGAPGRHHVHAMDARRRRAAGRRRTADSL